MTHPISVLLLAMSLILSGTANQQRAKPEQLKQITVGHFKDEPVEIASVKLHGKSLLPGDRFTPSDDWPAQLEITIKNTGSRSVSFVSASLITMPTDGSKEAVSTTRYVFGSRPDSYAAPQFIKEGETARLTHRGTTGDAADLRPAELLIQEVFWDNDKSTMWSAGKILRRRSESEAVYELPPQTGVRYRYPRWFQPSPAIIKAQLNPPLCDTKFRAHGPKLCPAASSTNCAPNRCYVTTTDTDICNPLLGTGCNTMVVHGSQPCYLEYCPLCTLSSSVDNEVVCQPPATPIIVDVAGDGIALTDRRAGVLFDLAVAGRQLVSWTAPGVDDAFLALDRNGNGTIDDGRELFGDHTPQTFSWAPNGFLALAEYDKSANGGNGDGVIDAQDSIFTSLRLWQDLNHNGVSESSELRTLAALQLVSMETNYKESRRSDEYGNRFRYRGKVTGPTAGRWAWDVFLLTA